MKAYVIVAMIDGKIRFYNCQAPDMGTAIEKASVDIFLEFSSTGADFEIINVSRTK